MSTESDKLHHHVAVGYPAGTDAAQPDNTAFVPSENEMRIEVLQVENRRLRTERQALLIMLWAVSVVAVLLALTPLAVRLIYR